MRNLEAKVMEGRLRIGLMHPGYGLNSWLAITCFKPNIASLASQLHKSDASIRCISPMRNLKAKVTEGRLRIGLMRPGCGLTDMQEYARNHVFQANHCLAGFPVA